MPFAARTGHSLSYSGAPAPTFIIYSTVQNLGRTSDHLKPLPPLPLPPHSSSLGRHATFILHAQVSSLQDSSFHSVSPGLQEFFEGLERLITWPQEAPSAIHSSLPKSLDYVLGALLPSSRLVVSPRCCLTLPGRPASPSPSVNDARCQC